MTQSTDTAATAIAVVLAALVAVVVFAAAALGALTTAVSPFGLTGGAGASTPTDAARADIPPDYLDLYTRAAPVCPGLDWSVLAAIGKVETDHGRSPLPGVRSGENSAGAAGPMQFLASTWNDVLAEHPLPPGGARPPSRYDPHSAIHAAAFYLCDNDAAADLRGAIFDYNHSTAYVDHVLDQAARYRAAPDQQPSLRAGTGGPQTPAEAATVPDPTGTGGRITPRMNTLYRDLRASGALAGGASCWDPHPQNPTSDHPTGTACDVFFRPTDPADVARGWDLARLLAATADTYDVKYVIWQGQIWTDRQPTWTTYRSGVYRCPDPTNVTGCHYDHIHISVH